jgi:hypothetical protein
MEVHLFFIVTLLLDTTHSERPCYGSLKLKQRSSNIYYYVIGVFLLFGLPPMAIDAATATIVAGRQAQFKNT